MKTKKVPMRMCVGCREMKPKRELIRIVKQADGQIKLDFTGKLAGRGAYICKDKHCMELCIKFKAVNKAFETAVSDEVYESLKEEMKNIDQV